MDPQARGLHAEFICEEQRNQQRLIAETLAVFVSFFYPLLGFQKAGRIDVFQESRSLSLAVDALQLAAVERPSFVLLHTFFFM